MKKTELDPLVIMMLESGPDLIDLSVPAPKFDDNLDKAISDATRQAAVDRDIASMEQDAFLTDVLGEMEALVEQDGAIVSKRIAPSPSLKVADTDDRELIKAIIGKYAKPKPDASDPKGKCNCSCDMCMKGDHLHCASETKCAMYHSSAPKVVNPEADRSKKISQDVRNLLKRYRKDLESELDDPNWWPNFEKHCTEYVIGALGA